MLRIRSYFGLINTVCIRMCLWLIATTCVLAPVKSKAGVPAVQDVQASVTDGSLTLSAYDPALQQTFTATESALDFSTQRGVVTWSYQTVDGDRGVGFGLYDPVSAAWKIYKTTLTGSMGSVSVWSNEGTVLWTFSDPGFPNSRTGYGFAVYDEEHGWQVLAKAKSNSAAYYASYQNIWGESNIGVVQYTLTSTGGSDSSYNMAVEYAAYDWAAHAWVGGSKEYPGTDNWQTNVYDYWYLYYYSSGMGGVGWTANRNSSAGLSGTDTVQLFYTLKDGWTPSNANLKPQANITPSVLSGPGGVWFLDRTIGARTIMWNFGDGSTGYQASDYHVYSQPGTYTAVQQIWMDGTNRLESYTIQVGAVTTPPPANDNFANASDLGNAAEVTAAGSNLGATLEPGELSAVQPGAGIWNFGNASVWYKWTAPASGKYSFKLVYPGTWTGSELYSAGWSVSTGTSLETQRLLASYNSMSIFDSVTTFSATQGVTYYISIFGMNGSQGTFGYTLGVTPSNDDVANAAVLAGNRVLTGSANTAYASYEKNEFSLSSSVWWKWTAPSDTWVTLDTEGSLVDHYLCVQQALSTPVNTGSMSVIGGANGYVDPDWGYPARICFEAKAGQDYYIGVGTWFGSPGGEVHFRLATSPANDNQAQAIDLGFNGDQTVTGDTFAATAEPGETDGLKSVWWKYTEQVGGKLEILNTAGSGVDTVLEVYAAASGTNLKLLRRCDDAGEDGHSRVAFPVGSGTSYYIRVADKSELGGNVTLKLTSAAPATTAAGHVLWARALLESLDGDGGISAADTHLAAALASDAGLAEANLLRAFTQLALLQQQSDYAQLLAATGVSQSGTQALRTAFSVPKDRLGVPITAPGATTTQVLNYLKSHLSTIDTVDGYLDKISGNSFQTSFSDSEDGRKFVKIDAGDVQMIRAGLRGIKAASYFSQTYDLAVDLDTVVHQGQRRAFTPEAMKAKYSNVLKFATSDRRNDFRNALKEANSRIQLGYQYATAVRAPEEGNHLCPMGPEAENIRANAASLAASLDGSVLWNGTNVDLSKFVSSGSSLRDFLMSFHERKTVANTAPDPLFGGVFPGCSQDAVNGYFQKQGLLYNVSSYAQWAAELLPGAAEGVQSGDANPAHDGINNRMKYAFGLDPLQPCSSAEFMVESLVKDSGSNQNFLTVSFVRRIDDRTLNYVVAVSDDLKTWDRTQTQLEQVGTAVPNGDGLTETVTFRFKSSAAVTARKFVRIEVSGPGL